LSVPRPRVYTSEYVFFSFSVHTEADIQIGSLYLFRQILDERQSLPKGDASNDLIQLINYILRKFFKKVAEDKFVIVETLGPKSRNKWKDLSSYKSEEEDDDGMGGQRARIREKVRHLLELEYSLIHRWALLSWSSRRRTN
jgi:replication fork protection complex subunit Tof1/Swi1